MGVDYTPQYGLGYKVQIDITDKVKESEHYDEEDEYLDSLSYLDDILEDTSYSYFETGSENYSGRENELFIVLDNPFDNGLYLTEKAKQLTEFLETKGIKTLTPFDLVGGLLIH